VLGGVFAGTPQAAPAEGNPVSLSVPEGEEQGDEVDASKQPAPAWLPYAVKIANEGLAAAVAADPALALGVNTVDGHVL
jgi:hypothetical protein